MPKTAVKRKQRLRKTKAQLIDELESLEHLYETKAQIVKEIESFEKKIAKLDKISLATPNKVQFKANSIIYNEGDVGDAAYVILSGQVEFRKKVVGKPPRKLAKIGEGKMFGDLALHDDRPRMASAIALNKTTAFRVTREEFLGQLTTVAPAMEFIVETLVVRVRKLVDELIRKEAR
jgi:CRP-like cAMP-binding protein